MSCNAFHEISSFHWIFSSSAYFYVIRFSHSSVVFDMIPTHFVILSEFLGFPPEIFCNIFDISNIKLSLLLKKKIIYATAIHYISHSLLYIIHTLYYINHTFSLIRMSIFCTKSLLFVFKS